MAERTIDAALSVLETTYLTHPERISTRHRQRLFALTQCFRQERRDDAFLIRDNKDQLREPGVPRTIDEIFAHVVDIVYRFERCKVPARSIYAALEEYNKHSDMDGFVRSHIDRMCKDKNLFCYEHWSLFTFTLAVNGRSGLAIDGGNGNVVRHDAVVRAVRNAVTDALACPNDTDGDGNCGRKSCPHCGDVHAKMSRKPECQGEAPMPRIPSLDSLPSSSRVVFCEAGPVEPDILVG